MACTTPVSRGADRCREELPPCPVCKGLECLCRPRFFAGQLLTEEDLNRLQSYVINKGKLRNRYLHGWGVACGLEVMCDACEPGNVVVSSGYALSPCGDDIVVCGDASVNVCELIDACRPREPVCDTPYQNEPTPCREGIEQWVLAVCYDETPTRGITALLGTGEGGCGCGGSCKGASKSGGSCGCAVASKPKAARPQCEPTQVCEGYRFKAYKLPRPANRFGNQFPVNGDRAALMAWLHANRSRLGPLLERVLCCVLSAMDLRAQIRENRLDGASPLAIYLEYAEALRDFAREFSIHDCRALARLNELLESADRFVSAIGSRPPTAAELAELAERMRVLDRVWMDLVAECFCSALLPSCPDNATDNCVPLAVVTLERRSCRILEICNWQERKLLITWPTVSYWLSWLPWEQLRRFVARLCCEDDRSNTLLVRMLQAFLGNAAARPQPSPVVQPGQPVVGVASSAAARAAGPAAAVGAAAGANPGAPFSFEAAVDSGDLMRYLLEDYARLGAGNDANAPQWAALVARFVNGRALAPLAGNAAVDQINTQDLSSRLGLERLRTEMETLTRTVSEQQKVIDALQVVNARRT